MDTDPFFDPATIRMAYFALLLSGRKYENLELAVTQEMLKLDRLSSERSLPYIVGTSKRIFAVIDSIEFEETSHRYLIKFHADNGDGQEKVRSERVDSKRGEVVKKIWGRDLVGHRVVIFKTKENVGSKAAPNGYRVSPYCIDYGKAK